jgi:C-terminal processing protease CtpA/Prc
LDAVKLTTAQIYWPVSGRSIHGRGVLPEDGARVAVGGVYGDVAIEACLNALNA